MIILDTNVVSELMKIDPAAEVFTWVASWSGEDLFTTAVTQAEVLFGLATMPAGRKRESLNNSAAAMFDRYFRGRILPFDEHAARTYADITAKRQRAGRPMKQFDAQIASIAAHRNMAVATRDTSHFEDCGIQVINPWTA